MLEEVQLPQPQPQPQQQQRQQRPDTPRREDDDVSYDDASLSTAELSIEESTRDTNTTDAIGTTRAGTLAGATQRQRQQLMRGISFNDGISRFKAHWEVLVAGQALSVLVFTSGAVASSLYYECNISVPATQTMFVFLFMSFHIFNWIRKRCRQNKVESTSNGTSNDNGTDGAVDHQRHTHDLALGKSVSFDSREPSTHSTESSSTPHSLFHLQMPAWIYFIIAFISVEATYCSFLALKFTNLTSASVLDNFNIFAAMVGSRIFLKRRYRWTHILGAFVCCLGVGINIFSDYQKTQTDLDTSIVVDDQFVQMEANRYPNRVTGDLLAVLGGILFGLNDVIVEGVMKSFGDVDEYLGMVGMFGFFISFVQAIILEKSDISKLLSNEEISIEAFQEYDGSPYDAPRTCPQVNAYLLVIGYAIAGYLFNVGVSHFLKISESALLTISILTADLWAIFFSTLVQHILASPLFYIAFICVVVGVLIYEISPSPLGAAEDLQIHKEIEMASSGLDPFQMSNISISWDSHDRGKEVV